MIEEVIHPEEDFSSFEKPSLGQPIPEQPSSDILLPINQLRKILK